MTQHSEQLGQISKALSSAQKDIRSLSKDSQGYGYKYLSLSVLMDYALPIITKHGLTLTQFEDGNNGLVTMLIHADSGEYIKGVAKLIEPDKIEMKGVNLAQKRGSILSYEKRYALQAILGITTNEDDNDASPNGFEKPAKTTSFKAAETKVEAKSEAVVATVDAAPVQRQRFKKGAANGSNELDL